MAVSSELVLHLLARSVLNNGFVPPDMQVAAMGDSADVRGILEHRLERTAGELFATRRVFTTAPHFAHHTRRIELFLEPAHTAKRQIACTDMANRSRLLLVDHQRFGF